MKIKNILLTSAILFTLSLGGSVMAKTAPLVHAPVVPVGATAQCRDKTYSFSQHRRGTCSWHGGVKQWINLYIR